MVEMTFEEFWNQVVLYKLELAFPFRAYKDAFACDEVNGCGAKGGIDFPDTMWGVLVTAACNEHDVSWSKARSLTELVNANMRFRRNLEKIIDHESGNPFTQWLRLNRMSRYYRMVKLIGTPAEAKKRGFI